MDAQGMLPLKIPITMAAQPSTTPAAGVIATSPVIIPMVQMSASTIFLVGYGKSQFTLNRTYNRRLPIVEEIHDGPSQQTHSGAYIRIKDGYTRISTCGVRISAIEAVPT